MVGEENAEKLKISLESDFIINCLPTAGDLANKHHIGITPTREALIVLTHDKLLEALPRTGYIVTKIMTRDILEVFHLRILLEVEAIGLAVEKITHKEIAELISNNN